ncbi:MAG: hypothetical protein GOV00_04145, partial [Candidatus Altiarchaeota archaeon]|nr:hypothetical protein [Candidatus Altiarchaeota archaeon]
GAMLIFIGGLINPWLVMVGYTMSYSVIILMVVYCMSYLYYCIDKEITW